MVAKLLSPISLLAIAVGSMPAAAAPAKENYLQRQDGGVFLCQDPDWQNCEKVDFGGSFCVDLAGTPFWRTISNFGPDSGYTCDVFEREACNSDGDALYGVAYPGWTYSDMTTNGWNDRIGSLLCKAPV